MKSQLIKSLRIDEHKVVAKISIWSQYFYHCIAAEISTFTRYYDRVIQWAPRAEDAGVLLMKIHCRLKETYSENELPDLSNEREKRTAIILNGNINHHLDAQSLLVHLKTKISRTTRIILIVYNPYLSWLYQIANFLGIRSGELPSTFLTRTDLKNIARISGFEVVRMRPTLFIPHPLFGLGILLNRILSLIPGLRLFSLAEVITLRPVLPEPLENKPSLSIVIPARNEKGNIEAALKQMPEFCKNLEIIFIEGHSTDGTWEEIQRVIQSYSHCRYKLKAFRQTGKGKADAVRLGFSQATGDLLTILDADLTMPPQLLSRYYDAYCLGNADFVNGTRLVYPMEGEAMKFLNRLGNIFFAKALSQVLDISIGDTLCGTKLMTRHDYQRMVAWRAEFGDFDPFGDFEMIFPAAVLGLGIIDIPIRYKARTYGSTNISRFRHGWMLLKMTCIGFFRIRIASH